ncbi:MAG: hypothetical protein JNL97_14405 [Verrucomicrobiales bacterium]|nr:hypothetical protein [Verrucomicrobiales bacterium]
MNPRIGIGSRTRTAHAVACAWMLGWSRWASGLEAIVEVEEEVYRHAPANNGAGPMWCAGSTCVARVGDVVYATGLETIEGAKPLNNCRWVLWRRDGDGWKRLHTDTSGRTREPAPLVALAEGSILVSGNPTLAPAEREGGGPARPEIVRFAGAGSDTGTPERWIPEWEGTPPFTEHSYRSFAAEAGSGEWVLFQNIDYTHAEWVFRDRDGRWAAKGRLNWPWGASYAKPQPVRICYPNVAVRGRAVHFFGVSDIQEPNPAWRTFKKELTGKDWDYDFRRLFYTWTPDITREPFRPWIEVSSRDATGGWLWPCDLRVDDGGAVDVIWTERAIDERLRPRFFPEARQSRSLRHARIDGGKIVGSRVLLESGEDRPASVATAGRFHPLPDGRVIVVAHVDGEAAGNRVFEWSARTGLGPGVRVPFARAFGSFFTATPRAGGRPSDVVDLLGVRVGTENTVSYARVRLR